MGNCGKIKKILFHSDLREWGGSEELWFRTAKIALKEGFSVGIYTRKGMLPQSKIAELQQYPNVTFFYGRPAHLIAQIINRVLRILSPKYRFYYIYDDFNEEAIKWQPDLVLFSHGNNLAAEPIIPLFRKNNIRYCTVGQAAIDQYSPSDNIIPSIKENFKFSQENYFVSQANLELTELQIGCKINNSKVVRNPFNIPYHNNLSYPDNTIFKLACVGRYDFGPKGQDILLKVLSQPKWKERNIEINLYGKGPNEMGIKGLINYFGLKNVFIRGFSTTIDIWKENHALVLPSRYEGLPLVIVEAMLCGRFAITTNVSGNGEIIINNENGFIAEAPQVEYLDNAMERAWSRKEEWQNIGDKAKKHIITLVPECPEKVFFDELLSKL
ncbi:MAG: glycosyltransferase family 4 protein [Prevotella sp.]|jgi:glycosyltransferase involved in cell wall biosynthesis|nr:glycosyltransferase family 4 protein [Prevotella sp.]